MTEPRAREILDWAVLTFGPVANDPKERALRLIEETLELVQAVGLSIEDIQRIAKRTYSRPPGQVPREVGQVYVTLALIAEVHGVSAQKEGVVEWNRIQSIPKPEWDSRHAAKVADGTAHASPLDEE